LKFISWLIGRLNENIAPLLSILFSAYILQPCVSTMLLEINNPRIVPTRDFVANFVKSLGIISGSMPLPVSIILTIANPSVVF
jgi:hypothetical protein